MKKHDMNYLSWKNTNTQWEWIQVVLVNSCRKKFEIERV